MKNSPAISMAFAILCGTAAPSVAQTPILPVKVQTQVVSSTPTGQSVYAWIQNTGSDTLRNLVYVWYMDWTDHGSPLVPELDWASVSGVTASAVLRPDYIAEARYSLGANKIAPGQTVQINTRFHMKDWSVFNAGNDWSYLGAKTTMADNPYASIFSDGTRIWGNPEQRVGPALTAPQVQVRTVQSSISNNALGLEVHVVNTGSVPATNVVARWISSTLGRTATLAGAVDYTTADTARLRILPANGTQVSIDMDLGGTIIGVGQEKLLRIRLNSSDWTNVDWAQDWSYPGVSATAFNLRVAVEVKGYPQTGSSPQDLDSDGDGWSDSVEVALGFDPHDAGKHPSGATMTGGYISDTTTSHVVTYNASSLTGYSSRTTLPLTVDPGAVAGAAPVITIAGSAPAPIFENAVQVGKILEISGNIRPGHTLTVPIPLPNGLAVTDPKEIQVVHYVDGHWRQEIVTKIQNGAAYTVLSSFSPVVVGLVLVSNTLAAGGKHGLWIRDGRPWSAGQNDRGQLGNRSSLPIGVFQNGFDGVYWQTNIPVVAVEGGESHSLALDANGSVWAWGDNQKGQCGQAGTGDATKDFFTNPVLVIDAVTNPTQAVVQIAAGDSSSYVLLTSGQILSWGANGNNQLGRGSAFTSPFDRVPGPVVRLSSDGTLRPLDSVVWIAGGRQHGLALRRGGEVVGWGSNSMQQLGAQAGPGDKPGAVTIPFNLNAYGNDTLRYTTGTPGGAGGILVRPWYAPPSRVGAGGDMSYAKLYQIFSQNQSAMNMVWGANENAQIRSPASAGGIGIPTSVSDAGSGVMALGNAHLVMLYDGGTTGTANGAVHRFPVQARGANNRGQSDPAAGGDPVAIWKELKRPGTTERMISSAVAAGDAFSMSYDYGKDSVYRWGDDWGAGKDVKAMATSLSVGPTSSLVDYSNGQKLSIRMQVPYVPDSAKILLWPLRPPRRPQYSAVLGPLVKGLNIVTPDNWKDPQGNSTWIQNGSYGYSVAYLNPVTKRWDTTKAVVGGLQYLSGQRTSSALSQGGPDSFLVAAPSVGVLHAYLKSSPMEYKGQMVDGSWDLKGAGNVPVAVWNISDSTKLPIFDKLPLPMVSWGFRSVLDGIRVTGNGCHEWIGENNYSTNSFLSETPIIRMQTLRQCNSGWSLANSNAAYSGEVLPSSSGLQDLQLIPAAGGGYYGAWSLGVGPWSPSNQADGVQYRSLGVSK